MNNGLSILETVIIAVVLICMLFHGIGFIKEFFGVLKEEEKTAGS